MDLNELRKVAARQGVPQAIVEKDFALSAALFSLSESELSKKIVFKGGTAIKKAYFPDARFSEDLDFTVLGIEPDKVLPLLKKAIDGKEIGGITFERIEEERTSAGIKASIRFAGPLKHPQRIRFDFSFRNNLVGKPAIKIMVDEFGFEGPGLLVLSLDEILAEKLHALCSRAAPRDMYDIWFLMKNGVSADAETVNKKFAFYNEKFSLQKAFENIKKIEAEWGRDLQPLMAKLPDEKEVAGCLKDNLERITENW
jgi:predicted nucleotidyltransferase component of viral defense system